MYVCLCNGLNEQKLKEAITPCTERVKDVFANLGCKQQCGSCTAQVREMILLDKVAALPATASETSRTV